MKNNKKIWILVVILFFATIFVIWYAQRLGKIDNLCEYAYVEKVYDGDTVKTDKLGKVRLLGIDAPEVYHPDWPIKKYKFYGCGIQSKEFAEKYLLHKEIKFCADKLANNKGYYGRYLRYAMIFTGGKYAPFGYISILHGWAQVYKYADFSWKKKYEEAEKLAKQNHIGMWSEKCQLEDKKFKEKYFGAK